MSIYGVPVGAAVDGYADVGPATAGGPPRFYLSFADDVTISNLGARMAVADEDVVYFNGSAWSMFFDGSAHGMTANALDLNAIGVQDGVLYFSTFGTRTRRESAGPPTDSDVYSWVPTRQDPAAQGTYARVFDASAAGVPGTARVDGAYRNPAGGYRFSFSANTTLPDVGPVEDEDIVEYANGAWSVWFDGTANGLTTNNLDIDAFSIPNGATAP